MDASSWEGRKIGGRYQIEELLGQGGMSSVYKAFDPNLQRMVAIKLVHPHLSNNQEFVRRFEVEATAVARLRHPNIIQVFDFNHDGNMYFMVLEFVPGETLQQRIKRLNASGRQLPVEEALRFTIDICRAADYAHQRGMVHRDIKPANVMLDVNGNAILMDFGIARIMGGQQHTATGAVLGTALYMSPEQIQGLHPDARADIYSVGVMLFESLSGRPPFEADSAMTLMMMHMKDPVPDIESLHPGIPHEIKKIVNRALEKDRASRYQSAAEMANALQKVLDKMSEKPVEEVEVPSATIIEVVPEEFPVESPATMISDNASATNFDTMIQAPEELPQTNQAATQAFITADQTLVEEVPKEEPKQKTQRATEKDAVRTPARPNIKLILPLAVVMLLILVGVGLAASGVFTPRSTQPVAVLAPTAVETQELPVIAPTETAPVVVSTEAELEVVEPTAVEEDTPVPEPTVEPTAEPTETPAPEPKAPVIAGADKIAFVRNRDIWAVNLDGSELQQLTTDGTVKAYLRWLPDGQGLSYISGRCIYTTSLVGETQLITCFNNSTSLDSFEVSPDGQRVALSLDYQLYLLPFDLERLSQANNHPKLAALGSDCEFFAHYKRNAVYHTRWSEDGKEMALVTIGVLPGGRRGDEVHMLSVERCIENPAITIRFPGTHFTFREYDRDGKLNGFTWDGNDLFVFNGNTRNDGFGHLHLFNRKTYKATLSLNPIDNVCCYHNSQFSPDGTYLFFAFQDIREGENSVTRLYYVPFGSLDVGARLEPLPIPEFTNPKENPQAILRKAVLEQ
jgi:serine/threonine protein kinase